MGGKSNVAVIVPLVVSITALSVSQFLMRRVRRRFTQSAKLRERRYVAVGDAPQHVGEYVLLRGTVGAADIMCSPGKAIQCVRYVRRKLRVVDQRVGTTTHTHTLRGEGSRTAFGLLGTLVGSLGSLFKPRSTTLGGGVSTSRQVAREKWGTEEQVVAREEGTAKHIMLAGANGASIALDLSGAEFLELEVVADDFEGVPPERTAAGADGRRTLGYRTTEEVLRTGAPLIVLGEIAVEECDGKEVVTVRGSLPRHMLDIKTRSVSRPFVATPLTEGELLHRIERAGRIYFWCAVPALAVGISSLVVARVNSAA